MIKKIIEISNQSYLSLKNQQLLIQQKNKILAQIPIEDIGVLILENSKITISQKLIIACQKNNTAIIFCDEKHLPYSSILPISKGHTMHNKILKQQINISQPTRKNLWKQIIKSKIKEQINTLQYFHKNTNRLEQIINKVKSDDATNCEAIAAQYYWKELFGKSFIRNQNLDGINAILNYGYSIIRAMIARSIIAAGLHPTLGIFHKNQYNDLCLADDLMEPFRPWVDAIAYQLCYKNKDIKISKETKLPFLELISSQVYFTNKKMSLMVASHYLMADLKRNYIKETTKLIYPTRKK